MNQAMQYIEDHLSEDIDYKQVAQIALTSEAYFKRLFSFLSGITLSEYIRNRRLSQAALDLKQSEIKIIDLAFKYGYTSPDAFTRAFSQVHGMTPTLARELQSNLKSYPMLTFRLNIQGGEPLNYRLEKKESFTIVGYKTEAIVNLDGESDEIHSFLNNLTEEDYLTLEKLSNGQFDSRPLYLSSDYREEDNQYSQDFYVAVVADEVPDGLYSLIVPKHTWAVFTVAGDWEKVNDTWGRIYTEWFPSSEFKPPYSPEFMISKNELTEIWIAVK